MRVVWECFKYEELIILSFSLGLEKGQNIAVFFSLINNITKIINLVKMSSKSNPRQFIVLCNPKYEKTDTLTYLFP